MFPRLSGVALKFNKLRRKSCRDLNDVGQSVTVEETTLYISRHPFRQRERKQAQNNSFKFFLDKTTKKNLYTERNSFGGPYNLAPFVSRCFRAEDWGDYTGPISSSL